MYLHFLEMFSFHFPRLGECPGFCCLAAVSSDCDGDRKIGPVSADFAAVAMHTSKRTFRATEMLMFALGLLNYVTLLLLLLLVFWSTVTMLVERRTDRLKYTPALSYCLAAFHEQ